MCVFSVHLIRHEYIIVKYLIELMLSEANTKRFVGIKLKGYNLIA